MRLLPPPQFFQHTQHCNAAASLLQCAFRHTSTSTHPHQLIEHPAPSSNSPTDFPIGCLVVVASSHPTHASKGGTVCKLTKKFVMISPDDTPTDVIRILPKSLASYHPNGRRKKTPLMMTTHTTRDKPNANTPCTTNSTKLKTSPSMTDLSASQGHSDTSARSSLTTCTMTMTSHPDLPQPALPWAN